MAGTPIGRQTGTAPIAAAAGAPDLPAIPERGWTLRVPGSSGPPAPGRERIQIPPLPGNGDPNPAPQEPPVLPLAPEVKPRGGVLRALVKALGLVLLLVTAALLGNLFLPQEGPHRQLVVALYPPLEGDGKSGPEGKGPGGAPLKLPVDPPPPAGPNFKQKWEEAEEKLKKSNAERTAALARGDKAEAARVQAEEREAKAEAGRLKAVGEALTARKEADAAASEATKERARADRAEQDAATARTRVEALEKTTAKAEKVHLEAKAVVRLVNSTGRELSYELSWQKWDGTETPWQEFKVNASGGRVHTQRGAIWVWVRFEQTAGNKVIRSMRFEQYLEKEEVVERQVRIVYHFEQEGKQLALRWGQAK